VWWPLNGLGFLTSNWYCYQAVVEDLFHNAQWTGGSGHWSKTLTRFRLWNDIIYVFHMHWNSQQTDRQTSEDMSKHRRHNRQLTDCAENTRTVLSLIIALGLNPRMCTCEWVFVEQFAKIVTVWCCQNETLSRSKGFIYICLSTGTDPGGPGLKSCHEFIYEIYCKMGWVETLFVVLFKMTILCVVWYLCVHLYIWLQYVSAPCTSLTQRKATTNSWLRSSARPQVCGEHSLCHRQYTHR